MANEQSAGTLETRKDAGEGQKGVVRLWLQALSLADEREKNWRDLAKIASERYRRQKKAVQQNTGKAQFNILYANIETLRPAIYNSLPIPDIRKRYTNPQNPEDPVAKVGAQILERALSYNIDQYDLHNVLKGVVHNSLLRGRGVVRIRYEPRFNEDETEVVAEDLLAELVKWDDVRFGPADTWEEVPWIAFRDKVTREEAIKQFGPDIGGKMKLDWVMPNAQKKDEADPPDIFKRAIVWQIWDIEKREVVFIAPSFKEKPVKTVDDPLRLTNFWPIPRPIYDIDDPDTMVPQVPYETYRDQAEELDLLTQRINRLTKVLKWRGVRDSSIPEFDPIKDAEDGELVPTDSAQAWIDGGGLDKAIWLMPIEDLITVIRELIQQREVVKQTIFEITGVSDIIRGQSDPRETLGAQRIKTEFGTLRLQDRQAEVQRLARDLFRMKAEIIAEHFSVDTLEQMTGIQLARPDPLLLLLGQPQQAPQEESQVTWEQVMGVLRPDAQRSYMIDVETDSTIQADLGYRQENVANFVEGTGVFINAVAPAVQAGVMQPDEAIDLYTGFAKNFKLGKQAEDALGRMAQRNQGAEPQQPQDPAAQAQAQAETEKARAEQAKQQVEAAKLQLEGQKIQLEQAKLQLEAQNQGLTLQFEGIKLATETELEREKIESTEIIETDKRAIELRIAEMRPNGAA